GIRERTRGGAAVPLSAAQPPSTSGSCMAACRPAQSCYALRMADQRALDAIGRIERALARIEAASSRAESARKSDGDGSRELERLQGAHQALRSRVEGAIGQID